MAEAKKGAKKRTIAKNVILLFINTRIKTDNLAVIVTFYFIADKIATDFVLCSIAKKSPRGDFS